LKDTKSLVSGWDLRTDPRKDDIAEVAHILTLERGGVFTVDVNEKDFRISITSIVGHQKVVEPLDVVISSESVFVSRNKQERGGVNILNRDLRFFSGTISDDVLFLFDVVVLIEVSSLNVLRIVDKSLQWDASIRFVGGGIVIVVRSTSIAFLIPVTKPFGNVFESVVDSTVVVVPPRVFREDVRSSIILDDVTIGINVSPLLFLDEFLDNVSVVGNISQSSPDVLLSDNRGQSDKRLESGIVEILQRVRHGSESGGGTLRISNQGNLRFGGLVGDVIQDSGDIIITDLNE